MHNGKSGKGRRRNVPNSRSSFWFVLRRLLLALLILLAASYPAARLGLFMWPRSYDPLAVPDLGAAPGLFTGWQMKLVDLDPQNCRAAFALAGITTTITTLPAQGACTREGLATLPRLSTASLRPEAMRCAIAARLYLWERHVLQPAAQRLLNEPIVEILHFGSYNCRTKRGKSSLSEHASANAFDISGFRTKSGKVISVRRDWSARTAEGKLLHMARDGLCDWFNVTLSPDYNADHADHFHVDMGWYRTCR